MQVFEYDRQRMGRGQRFQGLADLLAQATITMEGTDVILSSRAAIFDAFTRAQRIYSDGSPKARHVTTNATVHVHEGGRSATSRAGRSLARAQSTFTKCGMRSNA